MEGEGRKLDQAEEDELPPGNNKGKAFGAGLALRAVLSGGEKTGP